MQTKIRKGLQSPLAFLAVFCPSLWLALWGQRWSSSGAMSRNWGSG